MNVTLLDHMGGDLAVVNAARASFDKHTEVLRERDEKLISYLARHGHWTPFAHVQITVRIKAPFFIARQWFKHVVGTVRNEVSRRYVDDGWRYWYPVFWRGRPENAKQGSSGQLPVAAGDEADQVLAHLYDEADRTYRRLLDLGVAPEQARAAIPLGAYTTWVETMSLVTAARIYRERTAEGAQWEIRELARVLSDVVSEIAPVSWQELTRVE